MDFNWISAKDKPYAVYDAQPRFIFHKLLPYDVCQRGHLGFLRIYQIEPSALSALYLLRAGFIDRYGVSEFHIHKNYVRILACQDAGDVKRHDVQGADDD